MRQPLDVYLREGDRQTCITRKVADVKFGSVDPGGFSSVEVELQRPVSASLLLSFTDLLVFDSRTAEQVGGGRLLDQGRGVSESGEVWTVSAVGEGLASMQDRTDPYVLVDRSLDAWYLQSRTTRRLSADSGTRPNVEDEQDGLLMQALDGASIPDNAAIRMVYRGLDVSDQPLGCFGYRHVEGANSTNWATQGYVYNTGLTGGIRFADDAWTDYLSERIRGRYGVEFTNNWGLPGVRWERKVTGDANDASWSLIRFPVVQARVFDETGAWRTGSWYDTESILAHEAFIDMCVRFAPRLDIATARIDQGTFQFGQLAWLDGISPADALDDILETEPAFTWAVWERQANGKWRTEFRAYDTRVRYVASVDDGYSGPSPQSEIYNRVVVRGKNSRGREVSVVRTQDVPDLTAANLTRSTSIDMGDEVWVAETASKRGDEFLSQHTAAPNAGSLTVARPIYDLFTRRWVQPWNIRAGYLIRVNGVMPAQDFVNADGRDSQTTFRIIQSSYDTGSAQASLELDSYDLTEEQAIINQARKRRRKR